MSVPQKPLKSVPRFCMSPISKQKQVRYDEEQAPINEENVNKIKLKYDSATSLP